MSTSSPVAISATSSAPPRQPAKLFEPSQYALASSPDGLPGEWGGIALKPFPTRVAGERVMFKVGDRVPAEVARSWPIPNRMAMQAQRLVRYFETPEEAEQISGETVRRNPERAMMAAEAAAEKRPQRTKAQEAKIARSQMKRLATLARKKAEKVAEELRARHAAETPAPAPVEETQPAV